MLILARVLEDLGITGPAGADQDGYPGILGYAGPALSEVTGKPVAAAGAVHREHDGPQERGRGGADPGERALVRARASAAAGVHATGRDGSRGEPARGPRGDARNARDARRAYGGQQASSDGVSAGYRGQIGLRSSWAHAVAHNIEFQEGDVLVTETSAPIWGYNAELERAMIIGRPTDEMRRLFDHTVAAQQVGLRCAPARRDVRRRRQRRARPTSRRTTCCRTGGSTWAMRSGCATTRRRSSTPATTRRSSPAWSSRSSPASTRARSAASATPTPSSSPRTGSTSSPRTPATSRA